MCITTDLDAWWAAKQGYDYSNEAKGDFQRIMWAIDEALDKLSAMNSEGKFDRLPASVKSEFISAWQKLNAVRTELKADEGFMEAMAWKP